MRRSVQSVSLAFLVLTAPMVFAHAVLMHSTPADHSTVRSHAVEITLDFNSRIDAARSTLTLTGSAGKNLPLRMHAETSPSELKASALHLENGKYSIHWQVLATDGHITRGEIEFTVDAN